MHVFWKQKKNHLPPRKELMVAKYHQKTGITHFKKFFFSFWECGNTECCDAAETLLNFQHSSAWDTKWGPGKVPKLKASNWDTTGQWNLLCDKSDNFAHAFPLLCHHGFIVHSLWNCSGFFCWHKFFQEAITLFRFQSTGNTNPLQH